MAKHYKDKACLVCGEAFTPLSPNGKWCVECRKKVLAEHKKKYKEIRAARREAEKDDSFHTCDSPVVIEKCLTCKRKKCNGECADVMSAIKEARVNRNADNHD